MSHRDKNNQRGTLVRERRWEQNMKVATKSIREGKSGDIQLARGGAGVRGRAAETNSSAGGKKL